MNSGGRASVAGAAEEVGLAVVDGAPAVAGAGVLDGVILEGDAVVIGAVFHSCSILFASTPLLCAALTIYRNKQ